MINNLTKTLIGNRPTLLPSDFFSIKSGLSGSQNGIVTKKPYLLNAFILPINKPVLFEIDKDGIGYVVSHYAGIWELLAVNLRSSSGEMEVIGTPLNITSIMNGPIQILLGESYLYLLEVGTYNYVYQFDKRNPGNLTFIKASNSGNQNATSIVMSGKYIFVSYVDSLGNPDIYVLDAETLEVITTYHTTSMNRIEKMVVDGSYLICATRYDITFKIEILDIDDIYNIVELGKVNYAPPYPFFLDIKIQDGIIYLSGTSWILFVDIHNPSNPIRKSHFSIGSGNVDFVVWGDNLTFIIRNTDQIGTLNIKDFSNVFLVDDVVYSPLLDAVQKISMYGNRVYTIAFGGAAQNKMACWDVNGYYLPSLRVGNFLSEGPIYSTDEINTSRNIFAKGDMAAYNGRFQNQVIAPNIEPAYSYAVQDSTAVTTLSEQNKFRRILQSPAHLISNYQKQFDLPYLGGVYLGQRFIGSGQHVFDINIVLLANNVSPPLLTEIMQPWRLLSNGDYEFILGVAIGSTDSYLISSISADGADMVVTTSNPHGLSVDDEVLIEGTTSELLDESGVITNVSDNYHFTISTTKTGTDFQGRFFRMINESFRNIFFQDSFKQVTLSYKLLMGKNDVIFPIVAANFSPIHDFNMTELDSKIQRLI